MTAELKYPNWKYTKGILNNWIMDDIYTLEQAQATKNKFSKEQNRKESSEDRIKRLQKEGKL